MNKIDRMCAALVEADGGYCRRFEEMAAEERRGIRQALRSALAAGSDGCSCIDVDFGTYENQIEVRTPDHMRGLQLGCLTIRDTTCLDRCIADEVRRLWSSGIVTTGCCCGHGKARGYIGVAPQHVEWMLGQGYQRDDRTADTAFCWPRPSEPKDHRP